MSSNHLRAKRLRPRLTLTLPRRSSLTLALVVAAALSLPATPARAARLKDLCDVEGVRPNALVGVGLVVGLAGTGDDANSVATRRPLATALKHLGNVVDQADIRARNVALVMVTASLPPFARPGMPLDVTVSSLGTSKSLSGGTLIVTPLKGADQQTYAVAQGSITVGGFAVDGGSGSSAKKNHVTVAHIPGGGIVERAAPGGLPDKQLVLLLREPDFTTASHVVSAITHALGEGLARVRDPAAVVVSVPAGFHDRVVEFVAGLEALEATPDAPARVIIDERTGTIVVGANVSLSPAAIAYGGLSVNVTEQPLVSQPAPLSGGKTVTVPSTQLSVEEKEGKLQMVPASATVADVAAALNALGVKPRDLVAVFQALKAAGALHAEIQVL